MLEDTRIGLSLLVSIGRWARVSTPVAEGFLTIASAITGRNLYTEGRTLENLDLSSLSRNQMMDLLQNGI
jgi:opine dehydrogenase